MSPPFGDGETEAHRGAVTGPQPLEDHERTKCWSSPVHLLRLGTVFQSAGWETLVP